MGFYLVIFKKSLSTKNQDIKYNHLITKYITLHQNHLFLLKYLYPIYHIQKLKKGEYPT